MSIAYRNEKTGRSYQERPPTAYGPADAKAGYGGTGGRTAEELSSQAEQLQSTIAFFKVSEIDAHHSMRASVARPAHKVQIAHLHQKPTLGVPAAPAVRHAGIALEMGHGKTKGDGDSRDAEFEKF